MTGAPDDPDSDSAEDSPRSDTERVDSDPVNADEPDPAEEAAVDGGDADAVDSTPGVDAESTDAGGESPTDDAIDEIETDAAADQPETARDDTSTDDVFSQIDPADPADEADARDDGDAEGETDADEERTDHWPELPSAVERAEPELTGVQLDYPVSETVETNEASTEAAGATEEVEEFPVVEEDDGGFFGGGEGAPGDEELPLAEHIEEMVFRAAIVVGVAGAISVLLYPFGDTLINIIWNHVLPNATGENAIRPHLYAPLDLVITQFKVASLAGIIVAVPALIYETYAFMRPGLYPHERRYYLAAIPTSLILAVVGVLFAFFIVLPASFSYLVGYSSVVATGALALTSTFSMILVVMGYLALVFQLPLFMMLAVMMNLTTRQWIEDRRLLFWGAFAGLSFMFTSIDVSGVTPVIVAITMILLFEGTLLLLRWTGR